MKPVEGAAALAKLLASLFLGGVLASQAISYQPAAKPPRIVYNDDYYADQTRQNAQISVNTGHIEELQHQVADLAAMKKDVGDMRTDLAAMKATMEWDHDIVKGIGIGFVMILLGQVLKFFGIDFELRRQRYQQAQERDAGQEGGQ